MSLLAAFADIAGRTASTIGVTDTSPFPQEEERILDRIGKGLHGGLSFTYAQPQKASRPADSFPWASSIVVAAVPYLDDGDAPHSGRSVARFADGDRYARLDHVLEQIEEVLASSGWQTEIVYDDVRLIDRAVAVRAGIAWRGKSTMVLTPGAGPWILLGSVVTDAELPSREPMRRSCGECDACIPACPTDAIIAPGVLDARRCISAVLQRRGSIDRTLREAIGGRIYGCDDCLTACPPGKPALDRVSGVADTLDPRRVLVMSDPELESLVEHWYVPSRRMRFVRRNALVALGNTGDASALGLASQYLEHDDPLLRGHAAWAVGRIGGPEALSIVESAFDDETDESVREELDLAIIACGPDGVYADALPVSRPVDAEETPR
jgi:epoxyqueuosine reductase